MPIPIRRITPADQIQQPGFEHWLDQCMGDGCLNPATHIAYVMAAGVSTPVVSCDEHVAMMQKSVNLVGKVEPTIEKDPPDD